MRAVFSSEIPPTTRKRNRMEFDGKSTSFETNKAQTEVLERMNQSINKLNQSIDSIDTEIIVVGILSRRFQTWISKLNIRHSNC